MKNEDTIDMGIYHVRSWNLKFITYLALSDPAALMIQVCSVCTSTIHIVHVLQHGRFVEYMDVILRHTS